MFLDQNLPLELNPFFRTNWKLVVLGLETFFMELDIPEDTKRVQLNEVGLVLKKGFSCPGS